MFLEARDSFKNKNEIILAIKGLQLPLRSFTRRIEMMNSDVADQLSEDIANYICFSLQFDESMDMVDISQRWIFIRMIFKDISVI
ncbi:hypothetical protein TNCT_142191 [Trichonephila clavata]|uniref:Uncharacterized protein n=1 Tax=Trichonephila clavata TaxID=2740835 RepID=A0A8X6KFB1_TRICU|nr:hypothetical protein TNCT_142191 [Trichonephila clavata]